MEATASPPSASAQILVLSVTKRRLQQLAGEAKPRVQAAYWSSLSDFAKRAVKFLCEEALSTKNSRLRYNEKIARVIADHCSSAELREEDATPNLLKKKMVSDMLRSCGSSGRLPPNILVPLTACVNQMLSNVMRENLRQLAERRAPKGLVARDVAAAMIPSVVGRTLAQ